MKLVINVTEIVTQAGKEYNSEAYPGPGLYHNPTTYDWMLVYRPHCATIDCVLILGKGIRPPIPTEEYKELEAITATLEQPSGISASDLLKAIAISQNPLLAKELLK